MNFGSDVEMRKKWKAFVCKINAETHSYNTILNTIQSFLAQPFSAAVENKTFAKRWLAADGKWI